MKFKNAIHLVALVLLFSLWEKDVPKAKIKGDFMKRLGLDKTFFFLTVLCLSMVCFAPQAFSFHLAVGAHIKLLDGPGTTNGGEFMLYELKDNTATYLFNTFCLEKNEYFSYGQELVIGGISDGAKYGGAGGQYPAGSQFDPLDPRTAYLYYHFMLGDLQDYAYNNPETRPISADLLQNAIWFFENEIESPWSNNPFVTLANHAVDNNDWSGIGPVRVLNLVDKNGNRAQDQLYVPAPEPATMLLFGMGLIGLAGLGRRKLLKKKG